jgi:hypothetical protein
MSFPRYLLLSLLVLASAAGMAQADSSRHLKVAVFTPVYLDSAFTGDEFRIANSGLPGYMIPGLDFYHGVMMAIDSLRSDSADVQVVIRDSKRRNTSLQALEADPELAGVSMIIASFNTRNEIRPLADYARLHKVPLISATYPNDGGITANPYFIMLNPRINVHIEAVYKYLQQHYPTDSIILFRKKGNLEDLILYLLTDMNRKTAGTQIAFKPVLIPDTATVSQITSHLDSSRQSIILCGTLNEAFGMNLARGIADAHYPATIIGMPTWDGIMGIGKGIDMIYTTPYNLTRTGQLSKWLSLKYQDTYVMRPSDMFFKGFESMYHFTQLLLNHPDDLINHLSDHDPMLFDTFDLQPVMARASAGQTDYLENRQIYFIRKTDNKLVSVE